MRLFAQPHFLCLYFLQAQHCASTTLPSPKSLAFSLPHSVRQRIINTLQLFTHKNNIISHNFQPIYAL